MSEEEKHDIERNLKDGMSDGNKEWLEMIFKGLSRDERIYLVSRILSIHKMHFGAFDISLEDNGEILPHLLVQNRDSKKEVRYFCNGNILGGLR